MSLPRRIEVDVAVAGGGCGGTAAAIQAARLGCSVVLVEETPWLGGMITSAGVVAFDGNYGTLTCGFYRELVRQIEIHYGGPAKCYTGWVSRTSFEPRIVNDILQRMVRREELIQPFFRARATALLRDGDRITGFAFESPEGAFEVYAKVTIDATEYGDLIELGEIPHRLGRESRDQTGEPDAPQHPDLEIQDITYVAILKDYAAAEGRAAPLAPTTPDYDPALFRSSTAVDADAPEKHNHMLHPWETFIDYGRLPNHRFMINWPFHANDFPHSLMCFDRARRDEAYRLAKAHTLNFVNYIQTTLGHPELGIADNEFPTPDNLPFIPYIRETRRIIGDVVMREQDVLPAAPSPRPPLRTDSIAAGDYFLDHHHARAHPGHPQYFEEKYPDNAKFQVPFGVFFPRELDGFMAAEKSISVTHIVNGCTRLQPIVLLKGQAAGVIAAMAVRNRVQPRQVPVREVQNYLLLHQVMLYPYDDLATTDWIFPEAQRLALAGVVFDDETFTFDRTRPMTWRAVAELLAKSQGKTGTDYLAYLHTLLDDVEPAPVGTARVSKLASFDTIVTRAALAPVLCRALSLPPHPSPTIQAPDMPADHWALKWIEPLYRRGLYQSIWHLNFQPDRPVTREELTLLLDRAFDPFHTLP